LRRAVTSKLLQLATEHVGKLFCSSVRFDKWTLLVFFRAVFWAFDEVLDKQEKVDLTKFLAVFPIEIEKHWLELHC